MQLKWPKSSYEIEIPKFYQGPILSTTVHQKYFFKDVYLGVKSIEFYYQIPQSFVHLPYQIKIWNNDIKHYTLFRPIHNHNRYHTIFLNSQDCKNTFFRVTEGTYNSIVV